MHLIDAIDSKYVKNYGDFSGACNLFIWAPRKIKSSMSGENIVVSDIRFQSEF